MKLGFLYFGTMNCNETGDMEKGNFDEDKYCGKKGAEDRSRATSSGCSPGFSKVFFILVGRPKRRGTGVSNIVCSCLRLVKRSTPAAGVAPDPCSMCLVRRLFGVPVARRSCCVLAQAEPGGVQSRF